MRRFPVYLIAFAVAVATTTHAHAQAKPAAPPADTDVYHVMFVKAVPGQAAAEAAELLKQDPKDPLAGHLLLLRHQEGADWDYCLIQHLGPRATVTITPAGPTPTTPTTRAWHNDTFVSGPSWAEFSKAMIGAPASVYIASVHRAVPGRRAQLLETLNRASAVNKVPVAHLTLTHIEGGEWAFFSLDRYNSWPDLAADRTANTGGAGWAETRQNSAYHVDTIADRVQK